MFGLGKWSCAFFCFFTLMKTALSASEPSFLTTTYPLTLTFDEGSATPGGTTIHTFTATDDETGVIPFLDFVYDPADILDLLDVVVTTTATDRVATFTLKPNVLFDYETHDSYDIRAIATDSQNTATALVTVQIVDVGETPTMNPDTPSQSFTFQENAVGTVIGSPSFTIEDTDNLEVHTWSITGGTGAGSISINTNNGTITLKIDYDRDDPVYLDVLEVDVSITDKYGLSVTTTYTVTITDRNDNIPVCNPTVYSFNLDRTTAIGTTLATLTCTDADATAPNNEITYSFQTSASNSQYFNITGSDVKLETQIDQVYGEGPFTLYVLAVDGGSTQLTGTATLSYTIPAATTLPLTTTEVPVPGYDALSSDSNLTMLLIIAAFIAACILGYVLVLCWRWNTFGQCLPTQCPDRNDCRNCCTCCPGDDIEKALIVDSTSPKGFVTAKGIGLGSEAPNSRRHMGSYNTEKKGYIGQEAPNSRRSVGSINSNRTDLSPVDPMSVRPDVNSGNASNRGTVFEGSNKRRKSPMSIFS